MSTRRDGLDLRLGKDTSTAHVVGVLQPHQRGGREVWISGLADGRVDVFDAELPPLANDLELASGHRCACARLIRDAVGSPAQQDLVAVPRVHQQRDQIGHGARGHVEGGLFAQQLGDALLELDDGGVLPPDVVAYLGPGDGLAHRQRWFGEGVTAQIDRELGHGAGVYQTCPCPWNTVSPLSGARPWAGPSSPCQQEARATSASSVAPFGPGGGSPCSSLSFFSSASSRCSSI